MPRRPSLSITGHGPSLGAATAMAIATSTPAMRLEVQFTPGVWTPIDSDAVAEGRVRLRYGINGNGPLDKVAATGELQFALRNDAGNSGGTLGWYSPVHANVRSGWTFGIPIRAVFTSVAAGVFNQVKFRGKARIINPEPGRHLNRRTHVVGYDTMRDLAEADAREVSIQVDKSEDEILEAILAALPTDSQPPAVDFDPGVDQVPYALDDLRGTEKALSVAADVVTSSMGMLFAKGDGTLCYRNRHTMSLQPSQYTFDNTMYGLSVPSSQDRVYKRVITIVHPRILAAAPTDLLYTLPAGTSVPLPVGTTEIWTDYTDPDDLTRNAKIGGTEIVTTLVPGTHFAANSEENGSGTDQTADVSATLDPFSSTAKWTFVNTGVTLVYLTVQKVFGRGVRDPGPQTVQSYQGPTTAERPITIDLRYQNSVLVARSVGEYVRFLYGDLTNQVEAIEFFASGSSALMAQALLREPGDVVTVSETVTGLANVLAMIQSVALDVFVARTGTQIRCRWGLAPANATNFWQWGIVGRSEWGETTIYGF
jgi:hypothetical protein